MFHKSINRDVVVKMVLGRTEVHIQNRQRISLKMTDMELLNDTEIKKQSSYMDFTRFCVGLLARSRSSLVEIFLSGMVAVEADYRLQRMAYINTIVYPFTSLPLVAYCTIPAICLLTGKFIIPTESLTGSVTEEYLMEIANCWKN
ncbi:hypothetical protein IGI04_005123 [Brassica rapa subsp. trilocularis]|uniref:ABC-2 type transporter domain-containing protein n=1 Tax=Brassica rapa subsp. trilocularis TaxID=1813537 RepID=A0ABQ7ND40_BRACM|nr:hypothetical protein IGI04_005123 [Brassica rapa subsp. trilocularis]